MTRRVKKLHWVFERNVKTEGYFARTPVGVYIVYQWLPSADLGWFANYPDDEGPNYSSNDPTLHDEHEFTRNLIMGVIHYRLSNEDVVRTRKILDMKDGEW